MVAMVAALKVLGILSPNTFIHLVSSSRVTTAEDRFTPSPVSPQWTSTGTYTHTHTSQAHTS